MPASPYIGRTFANRIVAGSDSMMWGFGSQEPGSVMDGCRVLGIGVEWGLKLSANTGLRIRGGVIFGGTERALDMVRGGDVVVDATIFDAAGQRPVTTSRFSLRKTCDVGVKAGGQLTLNNCVLSDVLIGDYTIYDNPAIGPRARVVLNNCRHPVEGRPIIVRCLWGDVVANETNVSVLRLPDWAVKAYFALNRRYGDTRVGVPLPA